MFDSQDRINCKRDSEHHSGKSANDSNSWDCKEHCDGDNCHVRWQAFCQKWQLGAIIIEVGHIWVYECHTRGNLLYYKLNEHIKAYKEIVPVIEYARETKDTLNSEQE